jgi:hypothetical protein
MRKGRPPTLSAEQVRDIRLWDARRKQMPSPKAMAAKYGLSQSALDQIRARLTYKWVRP